MTSLTPSRRAQQWRAALAVILAWTILWSIACSRQSRLPASLSDREFSTLMDTLSEPAGSFTLSENLVSNELRFAESVRRLQATGGVYIGVGPEQNFSYIARLRPAMAFIVDIRRENRNLHLFYKTLFELSVDRADFVSRLFSRPRPAELRSDASVEELFSRYDAVAPSPEWHHTNSASIRERLLAHGFTLSQEDLDSIDRAFKAFYTDGPEIQFWGSQAVDAQAVRPSYRRLMTAQDFTGRTRSFLSSEERFTLVKDLHSRNLIVPVVGDFGGPTALRRVGDYIRQYGDVVRAFYGSNVGVYLNAQQMHAFCGNLQTLPAGWSARYIDSYGVRSLYGRLKACRPEGQ